MCMPLLPVQASASAARFSPCRMLQPLPHAPASAACFSLCRTLQPLPHASASAVRLALVMLESDLTLSRLYEETLYPYRD